MPGDATPTSGEPRAHFTLDDRLWSLLIEARGKCLLWFRFPAIIERFSGSEPPDFKDYSMVIIRLARGGSKKRPFYNIVATDSRSRRDGRFIERVGFYNPVATKGESLRIAQDRLTYWQGVGAQLSPTVERLVKQAQKAQPVA